MAFNVRPGGNASSVPVPAGVESGDVVVVGALSGIAQMDAQESHETPGQHYTTLALEGIGSVPDVDGEVAVGDVIYANADGDIALDAGKPIGVATRAKSAESGRVWLKLVPNTETA